MLEEPSAQDGEIAYLIQAATAGDSPAFAELMRRFKPEVLSLLERQVKNRVEVDELYQETSIRAFRSLGRLQQPHRFRGWLLRIAYNTSVDWIRRRQLHRRMRRLDDDVRDPDRTPWHDDGEAPHSENVLPYLVEEIARLKPKHAAAVLLRGLEGLTYREIASHLNVSLASVKIYLYRARHCLRNRMALVTVEDSVVRQFVVPPADQP